MIFKEFINTPYNRLFIPRAGKMPVSLYCQLYRIPKATVNYVVIDR